MKKLMMFVLIVVLLSGFCAAAEVPDELYEENYKNSGAESLEDALPGYAKDFIDGLGVELSDYESFSEIGSGGMLGIIGKILSNGLDAPMKALMVCLSIILLYSTVTSLGGEDITKIAGYVSILAAAAGALYPLVSAVGDTVTAVDGVGKFVIAFVPVYAGILLAGGGVATAAGFSTMLLAAAEILSGLITALIIPFISMYTALCFSSSATSLKLGGMVGSIKKIATWILGLGLTLFCGVLGLQTTITAAQDNLSFKTARFMAGSFLPVVGGAVGEALGTVSSCVGLLRSTVGAYGVIGILAVLLPVFAQLIVWRIVLLISESAAELFSAQPMLELFRNIGSAVSLLVGVIIWTALLFIISLTVVVIAGGRIQ